MNNTATEILFLVEEEPESGYMAKALGESIFTQAEDIPGLKEMVRDAVHCHFPEENTRPKIIRLHFNQPASGVASIKVAYGITLLTSIIALETAS